MFCIRNRTHFNLHNFFATSFTSQQNSYEKALDQEALTLTSWRALDSLPPYSQESMKISSAPLEDDKYLTSNSELGKTKSQSNDSNGNNDSSCNFLSAFFTATVLSAFLTWRSCAVPNEL